jgi:hypothetical protein
VGTPKQASAIVTIVNTIRRSKGKPPLTPEQRAEVQREVIAMSQPEAKAKFKELNAITGFDRDNSLATPAQLRRIRELEIGLYGTPQLLVAPTFLQASAKLTELATLMAQRQQGLKTVEQFANAEQVERERA